MKGRVVPRDQITLSSAALSFSEKEQFTEFSHLGFLKLGDNCMQRELKRLTFPLISAICCAPPLFSFGLYFLLSFLSV